MRRVAAVLCVLVAACSSAETAVDRPATDLQPPAAATAQPDPAPTTSTPHPGSELADEHEPAPPPGEPIGVTDRVTIVLVDP